MLNFDRDLLLDRVNRVCRNREESERIRLKLIAVLSQEQDLTRAFPRFDVPIDSHFTEDEDSDFKFKCGGRTFFVHKVVLRKIPYFAGLLSHKFKEVEDHVFTAAEDDEPDLFELMLSMIYGSTCEEVRTQLLQGVTIDLNTAYSDRKGSKVSYKIPTTSKPLASQTWTEWYCKSLATETSAINPYEAQVAAALLIRCLKFFSMLDKYQIPDLERYLAPMIRRSFHDAWSHQDVVTAMDLVHNQIPFSDDRTSTTHLMHNEMIFSASKRLDMLENEPSFQELLERNEELRCQIDDERENEYFWQAAANARQRSDISYCALCRSNTRVYYEEGELFCAWCREKYLSARRRRAWPHLDVPAQPATEWYPEDGHRATPRKRQTAKFELGTFSRW